MTEAIAYSGTRARSDISCISMIAVNLAIFFTKILIKNFGLKPLTITDHQGPGFEIKPNLFAITKIPTVKFLTLLTFTIANMADLDY
jgi:hypothetical protein